MNKWIAILAAAAVLAGCQGEQGPAGPAGPEGEAGANGAAGADGQNGQDGQTGATGATGATGEVGPAAPGYIALEASGVVGLITDASKLPVNGGTLYFVPASAVVNLGATTIKVDSDSDEPLEDAVRLNGANFTRATVGIDGVYRLASLPAGSYFVTWFPAEGDKSHLPGGSICRVARTDAELVGKRIDIRVSSATPADAHYVGSSRCITCHGRAHISDTMHRLGIWSTREAGPMQNLDARASELQQAFTTRFDVGTIVYFHSYDATRGFDKYKTSETDPGTGVSFTVTTRKNGNDYEMVIKNMKDTTDPELVLKVDAVYGGGVKKQRYMTKLTNGSGFFYALLPLQFQNEGMETYADRTAKVWRDYNGFKWFNETTNKIVKPAAKDSFEKNCVSCHAAGVQITGSDATTWTANTVEDFLFGDFDYNGDGVKEEMNVGCETCHGPGSKHWEAAGQGKDIVSMSLLTPEREAVVCGQCHSRPKGFLNTDSPVNADGWMMVAGTSRNEFLKSYATKQLDGARNADGTVVPNSDFYSDPDNHSKSHHQQYSDLIRSSLYKNDQQLVTCGTCHDPHRKTANERQLRQNPLDNTAACGSCHQDKATNLSAHLSAQNIPAASTKATMAKCVDCHMTKTAKTGSGQPGATINGTQYWMNDVTSHLFKVPDRAFATSLKMTVPYVNACATCHSTAP